MYRVETNKGVFHVRHVADTKQATIDYFVNKGYKVLHIETC